MAANRFGVSWYCCAFNAHSLRMVSLTVMAILASQSLLQTVSAHAQAFHSVAAAKPSSGGLISQVSHVAPYRCGVTSSKFARICRPSANMSCKRAVESGVKGYSTSLCAARHTACVSCLSMLRRCISRIGHAPRTDFSCDECTGKFSRCIGKRYPTIAR